MTQAKWNLHCLDDFKNTNRKQIRSKYQKYFENLNRSYDIVLKNKEKRPVSLGCDVIKRKGEWQISEHWKIYYWDIKAKGIHF